MKIRKKKSKKETQVEEKLDEVLKKEDIGDVLELVADENNPIGDGREFPEEKED